AWPEGGVRARRRPLVMLGALQADARSAMVAPATGAEAETPVVRRGPVIVRRRVIGLVIGHVIGRLRRCGVVLACNRTRRLLDDGAGRRGLASHLLGNLPFPPLEQAAR